MSIEEKHNWLVQFFFIIAILYLLYIILIFSIFGLIFYEIAFLGIPLAIIGALWTVNRFKKVKRGEIQEYRNKVVAFSFIVFVGFSIFAVIPFFYVYPLGEQFEDEFEEQLGDDYWEKIPKKYRDRLIAPGDFFDLGYVRNFFNDDVKVEKDIEYGDGNNQIFDKYEDTNIEEDEKPALIFIHGGGSTDTSKKDGFQEKAGCIYFASIGFVAFSIEYTPATEDPFPKGVKDCRTAIAFIKSHALRYNIDPDKMVLMGGSRGGHLSTLCAYTGINNDTWWQEHGGNFTASELEVACVIDLYGAVDQFYGAEHGLFIASRNEIIFDGTPEEERKIYEKHTVKNYVTKRCPPTLVMHGSLDMMVSVGESLGLVEELEKEGVLYAYLEVPFGQHGFDAVPGTAGNRLAYYFIPRFILYNLYK